MYRVVGGVQVKNDLLRFTPAVVVTQKVIVEEPLDAMPVVKDPVIPTQAGRLGGGAFHPLQCGLTGKCLAGLIAASTRAALHIRLLAHRGEQRIVSQLFMVVQIFISEAQSIRSLRDHLANRMLGIAPVARVNETPAKPIQNTTAHINLSHQQRPAVGGDRSAVKLPHNLATSKALKLKLTFCTLLVHCRGGSFRLNSFMVNKL